MELLTTGLRTVSDRMTGQTYTHSYAHSHSHDNSHHVTMAVRSQPGTWRALMAWIVGKHARGLSPNCSVGCVNAAEHEDLYPTWNNVTMANAIAYSSAAIHLNEVADKARCQQKGRLDGYTKHSVSWVVCNRTNRNSYSLSESTKCIFCFFVV